MTKSHWTGIEIHAPYVDRFNLRDKYGTLIVDDARRVALPPCDVVILGDVLEHMPVPDAICLWNRARLSAKLLIAGIPVICLPQGEWEGNAHEAHVSTWNTEMVMQSFAGITSWTSNGTVGAFIAEGAVWRAETNA
jgi:hypothetical protein